MAAASDAPLGTGELVVGDPLVDEIGNDRIDPAGKRLERHAAARRGVDAEAGIVDGEALVAGAGAGGDALFDDELPIEAAGGRAAENLGEHVERFGDAFVGGRVGRREIGAASATAGARAHPTS